MSKEDAQPLISRDDIYENIPAQMLINQKLIEQRTTAKDVTCDVANRKLSSTKESLYATPISKSDRVKCRGGATGKNTIDSTTMDEYCSKGNNAGEVLEDRRILSFLKDTTQLQKKMELHRDFPNSNFSCLAREEHFLNLVQQNVMYNNDTKVAENQLSELSDVMADLDVSKEEREANLERLMEKKETPDKKVENLICLDDDVPKVTNDVERQQPSVGVHINREWVLKKIAMSLEQRSSKKPTIGLSMAGDKLIKDSACGSSARPQIQAQCQTHMGCLILGSNGSGKTAICQSILDGVSGTKGILNRKLLGFYFVDSQNPDCHNLSIFIRSLILQILSHSSYLTKEDGAASNDKAKIDLIGPTEEKEVADQKEEVKEDKAPAIPPTKSIVRQQSEPIATCDKHDSSNDSQQSSKSCEANFSSLEHFYDGQKRSGNKSQKPKISKIPVKIGSKSPKHELLPQGGGENLSDFNDSDDLNNLSDTVAGEAAPPTSTPPPSTDIPNKIPITLENDAKEEPIAVTNEVTEDVRTCKTETIPPPLPKSKSCRTSKADEYYEMLISNPDIFESLCSDNIEKNPDECFKKAIVFPLLELTPPNNALLLLIDSIDENYINEGCLISTQKGRTTTKSRNIAELLSNHIHLFPKWLFIVCTAKKQNKHITKIFSGFKKITLDDLRKSHVVKDVQEYIISRLNSDFKGAINLSKEVIESLNQLYIKSNGCILYLQKVLNGIKESFFSFREIKLIPCTLNGLYLYICQKSFNKKLFSKIRPILNVLLACSGYVEVSFVWNCLRAQNYSVDREEVDKRLGLMRHVLIWQNSSKIKIFHNSFCDWLVDVKFATKKFLCDVNEGHVMISMYYTLTSDTLCPNQVRKYIYHLIKCGEYLTAKNIDLDLILILVESKTNLSDCFYTNLMNCCEACEDECKNDQNYLTKTRDIIEKFLCNQLNEEFSGFLCDFFKPNLPTDAKTLKLLIETGVNNADCQLSYDSSMNSPNLLDKSLNIDSELADMLVSSERSCQQELKQLKEQRNIVPKMQDSQPNENLFVQNLFDDSSELNKGKALIHILANEGNFVLLERALRACKDPIDLEIEDAAGQTALNIASRNGHIEFVQLLLNITNVIPKESPNEIKEVDVNHADHDGWTPLRSASWGGHTEVVKLLIDQPYCAIDLADKEERTALRAAAWSGHEDILKILINAKANVNSVDKQGRTSLIAASYMGHFEIVEILLENGADVNHLDVDGRSALCVAALCGTSGYNKVISCLLEHGANTDQLDNDGMSPLLVSSFEGNTEVCELLLENGADPDLADFMGRTPLWAACTAGHANVVKILLFWGCGIDCMDSEGRTVLSIAAAQGNLETVRQLLDRGLDETHRDNAGWTPLHYASFEGYADICTQLVESGAKIDECDNEGKTGLHLAAQEGREQVIEALLSIHNGFVDLRAHDGKTAFRLACMEGHLSCINALLKFSCDVNLKDADSRTTLYILALENKIKIVKYLLKHSNINVNIPDSEGRTALHVSSWQGHIEMVRLLIAQGQANVNAMDLDCRTPLHSCAWQGNHEVMDILLYYGAVADHACKQGATALGISAQEGHEQCVINLLKYGANPYKSDHCGRTPMKLAAKSNRINVLRVLENYNSKNDDHKHNNVIPHHNSSIQKSPDKPTSQQQLMLTNQNLLMPNATNNINATNSSQSSNNFYENTMQSDSSSLQKRKSVISSQSTGSSNNEAPLSFTQQLQRNSRHHHSSRHHHHNQIVHSSASSAVAANNSKYSKGSHKHSQILPNVDEHQINLATHILTSDADLTDMDCMSPLYATPPHSPTSDISSPGQHPLNHEDLLVDSAAAAATNSTLLNQIKMDHFARDTHMRIILGNANKESNHAEKSKRSGIATNPAVRMIRNRFDSAAQLIRRTNNMLSSNSNSQGSSSIGVKSGTFQWRKESQM